jgi:hypothetical protein
MNNLIKATLLTAALIPAASFASFYTGNSLLAACEGEGHTDFAVCIGYIAGINDSHENYVGWKDIEPYFCRPKDASAGQLLKIVVKHLNENPENLHYFAGSQVIQALVFAFPPSSKDDGSKYCPE